MKRLRRRAFVRPVRRPTGEPTLPLINVIFLLLIFVLLTSVIEADPPVPVDLPYSSTSPTPDDPGRVVFLSADGKRASELDILDQEGLQRWVDENEPDLVAVRADRQLSSGELFTLVSDLEAMGVPRIELVVLTP